MALPTSLMGVAATAAQAVIGAAKQTFTVDFEGSRASGGAADIGQSKRRCGYSGDINFKVPDAYIVQIENNDWEVRAVLQDKLSLTVTSEWEPFVDMSGISNLIHGAVQFASHRALVSRWTSRRIWKGTSPLRITLTLKFEAVYDAGREVTDACLALQQMVLPGQPKKFLGVPLLAPPGPSPHLYEGEENDFVKKVGDWAKEGGDEINIIIGKLMEFKSVIIKDAQTNIEPKFTVEGDPVGATVDLVFETYEIFTKDAIAEAYMKQ